MPEEPEITFRLDDGEVSTIPWFRGSIETETYWLGSDYDTRKFVWQLMNSDRFAARIITDYILTATFELEGLAEALLPFKDSCDWVGF